MRFALVGGHADGIRMAQALEATGRHKILALVSSDEGRKILDPDGKSIQIIKDLEELLANPSIDAVIVGGNMASRPHQLRRALQSERHVLCVHPADDSPDLGYEAAMIQNDTGKLLFPLLPDVLHPGILRLREILRNDPSVIGPVRLMKMERREIQPFLPSIQDGKGFFPHWDVFRALGGEIAEVGVLAKGEFSFNDEPLIASGRFAREGLFQLALVPDDFCVSARVAVIGPNSEADLVCLEGWENSFTLSLRDKKGESEILRGGRWNPWPVMVEVFEREIAALTDGKRTKGVHVSSPAVFPPLSWQDAIRSLELDDAARRSLKGRKVITLEYQEANEEVGFKGTMTLVGCGLLWLVILMAILSSWYPRVGWAIVPAILLFLGLQMLRWLVPVSTNSQDNASVKKKE